MSTETKNAPVEKIRVGTVQAAIWKHTAPETGGVFYKTTFENGYKDGDQWKSTSSYGEREALNLAKAALLAHSKTGELIRADKKAAGETADE